MEVCVVRITKKAFKKLTRIMRSGKNKARIEGIDQNGKKIVEIMSIPKERSKE